MLFVSLFLVKARLGATADGGDRELQDLEHTAANVRARVAVLEAEVMASGLRASNDELTPGFACVEPRSRSSLSEAEAPRRRATGRNPRSGNEGIARAAAAISDRDRRTLGLDALDKLISKEVAAIDRARNDEDRLTAITRVGVLDRLRTVTKQRVDLAQAFAEVARRRGQVTDKL